MKIFGREIKVKFEKCSKCGRRNLIIEIETKKWFKGKEFEPIKPL